MDKYKHFFFNNLDLACFASTDGYFEEINKNFYKVLGYNANDLIGKKFIQFIHPNDVDLTLKEINKLTAGIDTVHFINRYKTKSNTYKYLEWNSQIDAETKKIHAIARDVTEQILAEEEKEKHATELLVTNKALEKAENNWHNLSDEWEQKVIERTAELELINKELESFSYSVSHDLRAPLRAINGFATIIEDDYLNQIDGEAARYLKTIISNSKKMGTLIDDLLTFSKLGRKEVTTSELNMTKLVESVKEELLQEYKGSAIEFNIHQLPAAQGDKTLIKQVWVNLISNAIKYTGDKSNPRIEIGATEKDDQVIYFIKDNGAGFDMKYYDQLFGVFQRLHSSDEFEGTGIGLAIVQKIITRHKGLVWAESTLNEGACFYFNLPNINSQ